MKQMFSKLEDFGEDENLDEWELIDERPVDYDQEYSLDEALEKLNSKIKVYFLKFGTLQQLELQDQTQKATKTETNQEGVQF